MSDYHIHTQPGGVRKVAACAIKRLLPIAANLRYLVVTGQSGIVPGSIAAYSLGLDLVIIRKEGEQSHGARVEAPPQFWTKYRAATKGNHSNLKRFARTCCILDDFIAFGGTLRAITAALQFWPYYTAFYTHHRQDLNNGAYQLGNLGLSKLSFNIFIHPEATYEETPV